MGNAYTSRLVPSINEFKTESISDGNYDFPISENAPNPNNIIEFIYCIDANGAPVTATAGTFTIQGSPARGKTFDDLQDNVVTASDSMSSGRTKPSGRGIITVLRINASGLTASGAVGFIVGLNQHI